MSKYEKLLAILRDQVKPALGCTEPGAVAYGVARAKELLGGDVKELRIRVDKNILKNGMDVGIPGTQERGIVFAAALSLVIGKAEYGLEVLRDVDAESIEAARDIVEAKVIKLDLEEGAEGLYIQVDALGEGDRSRVIIKDSHTKIVFESRNDEVLLDREQAGAEPADLPEEIKQEIKNYSFADLFDFTRNVPLEKLAFIQDGIDMNMRIARANLAEEPGIGIGKHLYDQARDVFERAKAYTAAASEARMSGYPLPVMSSAGSGNHGLVAIIPIAVVGAEKELPQEQILRAVTLSHLITIYVKVYTGALSPVCGCGIAAGVGCAAGLTYLLGGSDDQIMAAVNNMVAGITGMLCDGAKLGCSYKLSIAVDAAVDAAKFALQGITIPADNGILGETAEDTVQNMALVSRLGMKDTDRVILDVMLQKCL
ncbi:MAG: L-serine ammonia-lyase, iron-sulfur-dependent, subunit alpha [bacterium]|jgi:L-cysteine desulfidase|nr:serine dehydratase subunit alpha family protein [Bacillota bacterium]